MMLAAEWKLWYWRLKCSVGCAEAKGSNGHLGVSAQAAEEENWKSCAAACRLADAPPGQPQR